MRLGRHWRIEAIALNPIATMVQQMLAAGVSSDMIVAAVHAAEEASRAAVAIAVCGKSAEKADISAERRRAADRERKSEIRRNRQNSADFPQTQENTSTIEVVSKKEASKKVRADGARLSAEWEPAESDLDFARSQGLDGDTIRVEATKFRNHWVTKTGKDATKLNWSLTWQNWILNGRQFNGQRPGALRADHAADCRPARYDPVVAGVAKLADRRMRAHDERKAGNPSEPSAEPDPPGFDLDLRAES